MSENDNHPQEWTPSVEEIRACIRYSLMSEGATADDANGTFDRFLAEVRAEAWDEGARSGPNPTDLTIDGQNVVMYTVATNPYRSLSPSTPNPETEKP